LGASPLSVNKNLLWLSENEILKAIIRQKNETAKLQPLPKPFGSGHEKACYVTIIRSLITVSE